MKNAPSTIALLLALLVSRTAFACYCGDLEDALDSADVIFEGQVVEVKLVRHWDVAGTPQRYGGGERLVVEVHRVFKGHTGPLIEINNTLFSCKIPKSTVGDFVFIAAYKKQDTGAFHTSQCSGSRKIKFVGEEHSLLSYVGHISEDYQDMRSALVRTRREQSGFPWTHVGTVH